MVDEAQVHEKVEPERRAMSSTHTGEPETENSTRATVPELSSAAARRSREPETRSPSVTPSTECFTGGLKTAEEPRQRRERHAAARARAAWTGALSEPS